MTSKSELDKLVNFFRNEFMPDAEEYCFSLAYTGEASLHLDYLLFFDSLIAKYEGYLFSQELFTENNPLELFKSLPLDIQKKYNIGDKKEEIIFVLNQILQNEHLWKYYNFKNNEYVVNILNFTDNLSLSKTVTVNRLILNDSFKLFPIKENIKFMSMSFMTNGTLITDKYINFLKSIYMTEIWVSIDGNQRYHDKNRCYENGFGTFFDVIKGIQKLQKNNISVNASVVITPSTCNIYETINYLLSIGIKKINFSLSRGNNQYSEFSKEQIDLLLNEHDKIYTKIIEDIITDDFTLLNSLKNNYFIMIVGILVSGNGVLSRCKWGTEIIINTNGDIYHCNSTIENHKDYMGNWKKNIDVKNLFRQKNVNDNKKCRSCFAKYLCGGTCYAEIINDHLNNVELECYYRKKLITKVFILCTKLKTENQLTKFLSVIAQ